MVRAKYDKNVKSRIDILIMRPKGKVIKFKIATHLVYVILITVFLIALILAASVIGMHRYANLYVSNENLCTEYQSLHQELKKLKSRIDYEDSKKNDSYANLLDAISGVGTVTSDTKIFQGGQSLDAENNPNSFNQNEIIAPADASHSNAMDSASLQASDQTMELAAETSNSATNGSSTLSTSEQDPLDAWGKLFPDPVSPAEQNLTVENFHTFGSHFKFSLVKEGNKRKTIRGHILMAFKVISGEQTKLVIFPEHLDPASTDFSKGPGYNIKSKKIFEGSLKLNPGETIKEMMLIVQAKSGDIVLKEKVFPQN